MAHMCCKSHVSVKKLMWLFCRFFFVGWKSSHFRLGIFRTPNRAYLPRIFLLKSNHIEVCHIHGYHGCTKPPVSWTKVCFGRMPLPQASTTFFWKSFGWRMSLMVSKTWEWMNQESLQICTCICKRNHLHICTYIKMCLYKNISLYIYKSNIYIYMYIYIYHPIAWVSHLKPQDASDQDD